MDTGSLIAQLPSLEEIRAVADVKADPAERLNNLSTAHLADACLRVGVPLRCAPAGMTVLEMVFGMYRYDVTDQLCVVEFSY
jgi:hypothetical protein